MSIYASTFDIGFEHKTRCAKITKTGRTVYRQDDSKPCTCGSSPIIYKGSHILPHDKDERGGDLMLAAIPGHISQGKRRAISNDMRPYHPWLRVDLNESTVVLTRKQVELLRDYLTAWLNLSTRTALSDFDKL